MRFLIDFGGVGMKGGPGTSVSWFPDLLSVGPSQLGYMCLAKS